MKKISLILIFALTISFAYAQKGKINSAYSSARSGKLDRAKELFEKGINHRKCIKWAKSYFVKGVVYQNIFETPIPAYKKLAKTPLVIAYDAYKKCIDLDKKQRFNKKILPYYKNLKIDFSNVGAKYYNEGKFELAYQSFKNVLEINNSKIFTKERSIDTAVIYYIGLSAYKANKNKESIKYYEQSLKYSYKPAKCYASLAELYTKLGNKEKGLKYLHEGYEKYPDNLYMLGQLINYYLLGGEPEKAEKYLDAAIKKQPDNISFYTAKGSLYEKMKKFDKAIEMYDKVLEMDSNNFIALYNRGLFKYNKIMDRYKVVDRTIIEQKEYTKQMLLIFKELEKIIPDFEKAYKLNSKEIATVIVLKEIYTKLRNQNKDYMAKFKYYSKLQKEMQK